MIHFSCAHCGMKFKVKDEFAGRASKCSTCKRALTVPEPDKTVHLPAGQIDGTASSVHQAGVQGGVTLQQQSGQKSLYEMLAGRTKQDQRYIIEGEIARGGMGAVLRAVDCDIRREVAVKFMLDDRDSKKKQRFIEEAQITGQLEHPNIPPIHELGLDAQQRLFFSMKMVRGRSLKDVLDQLRENSKQAEKDYSLGRLLNVFVNVCNGIAYAHSRGVVHRDLKPANIMTGDFGEVYVMDWGLAKVLKDDGPVNPPLAIRVAPSQQVLSPMGASIGSSPSPTERVMTSRQPEADLTQEGAIVGTPMYMPPEQALGDIDQIDQRSDVYSLGAILYEMLTLVPPVEKEGGYMGIIMRVVEGKIVPPEQRNPNRAIPRELSAIAMKALAKESKDRYQDVEALRQDIERFQEGRSVSAKEDTFREAVWKLVKRNQGASVTACMGLFILAIVVAISFNIINNARLRAEEANRNLVAEKEAKRLQAVNSVPAYLRAAHLCVNEKQFDDALTQVDIALEYDRSNADAQLLKGKVLIVRQDFQRAATELQQYLRLQPKDQHASKLLGLCRQVDARDTRTVAPIVEVFLENQEFALAMGLGEFQDRILAYYRKRIEAAWPGLGKRLRLTTGGKLDLDLSGCKQVTDLAPLQGMPLDRLNVQGCGITTLKPLTGMPLSSLNVIATRIQDLTPLKGMQLTSLSLGGCWEVRDLTPLKGMPLTSLGVNDCQVRDLAPLQGMKLKVLGIGVTAITDLTPLEGMELQEIGLTPKKITQGMDVLRQMSSVAKINGLRAAEFWKKYDAGELNK